MRSKGSAGDLAAGSRWRKNAEVLRGELLPPLPLVGVGLAHGLGDVLGADLEEVQQLLGLPAAGHTAHRHAGHHHAGFLPHRRQHRLPETPWGGRMG